MTPRLPRGAKVIYDYTKMIVPGPADLEWARQTLERARIQVAKNVANASLLRVLLSLKPGWKPDVSKEGPRR